MNNLNEYKLVRGKQVNFFGRRENCVADELDLFVWLTIRVGVTILTTHITKKILNHHDTFMRYFFELQSHTRIRESVITLTFSLQVFDVSIDRAKIL